MTFLHFMLGQRVHLEFGFSACEDVNESAELNEHLFTNEEQLLSEWNLFGWLDG